MGNVNKAGESSGESSSDGGIWGESYLKNVPKFNGGKTEQSAENMNQESPSKREGMRVSDEEALKIGKLDVANVNEGDVEIAKA